MTKEDLLELKRKLSKLSEEESKERDLYLRQLALGEIQGPSVGYASIDKPWLKFYDNKYILPILKGKTAYQMIYDNNKEYLNEKKINYYGRKFSYKEMFEEIEKYKKGFLNLGVKAGDIVTFATVTTPELIFSIYALNRIGAISNLVDPRTQAKGLKLYLNETKSKYLFCLENFIDETKKGVQDTSVEKVFIIEPTRYVLPAPLRNIKFLFKNSKDLYDDKFRKFDEFYHLTSVELEQYVEDFPYQPNYPVAITHTGGTTGLPKGVLLTNDNFNGIAYQFENSPMEVNRNESFLNVTVPFVAFGIINAIHYFLYKGLNNIIIADYNPTMTKKLVEKYDPHVMLGAPSYFEGLLDVTKIKKMKFPIAGAEASKVEFEKRMNDKFKELGINTQYMKGYGMTEVSACATVTMGTANKIGSVGIPLVDTSICIVDPKTGIELPLGKEGEICISGPGVMRGYYENEKETNRIKKINEDGKEWIYSGDIGYMDNEGLLYITDRIKRIFTINGFKIYPSRLENLISSIDGIEKCSVIGIEEGNNYKIVVYLVSNGIFENDVIQNQIYEAIEKSDLASYYVPSEYIYIDDLPINNAGKVDVLKLEDEYSKQKIKVKVVQ